jgi:amidase
LNGRGLKDLKIAVWKEDDMCPVSVETKARVDTLAQACADAGATIDEHARPDFSAEHSHKIFQHLLQATMASRMPDEEYEELKRYLSTLDPDDDRSSTRTLKAQVSTFKEWKQSNELREHLRWKWHLFFQDYDVLITPTMPTPAFPHDHRDFSMRTIMVDNDEIPYFDQVFWAGLSGVSYLPATVIPTGLNPQGLPIGLQIVGPEYGDLITIEVARQLEAMGFEFTPPPDYL